MHRSPCRRDIAHTRLCVRVLFPLSSSTHAVSEVLRRVCVDVFALATACPLWPSLSRPGPVAARAPHDPQVSGALGRLQVERVPWSVRCGPAGRSDFGCGMPSGLGKWHSPRARRRGVVPLGAQEVFMLRSCVARSGLRGGGGCTSGPEIYTPPPLGQFSALRSLA